MVLSLLKSGGLKCSASGFNLWVDPGSDGRLGSLSGEEEQKKLILKTETELPINFPISEAVIQFPGEYEISGVKIKGIEVASDSTAQKIKTIYSIQIDEMNLCFLGQLTKELSEETLDKLEAIDILFLPAGAPYINLKQAVSLIKELEPKIVIPTAGKDIPLLLKEIGGESHPQDKLTIKRKDLGERGTKLIWLTAK